MRTRLIASARQLWLPVLLIGAWLILSASSTNFYFPPLATILAELATLFGTPEFWADMGASVRNLLAGLVIGTAAGVLLGVAVGMNRILRRILDPFLQFARSVPQVALVPIVIGVLGIAAGPKIWAIGFACLWPVLLNTIDGIRAIDSEVRDVVVAYRVPVVRSLFRVILPAALPQIMGGIRVALSIAVVIMVVSEVYGASEGIGHFINVSGSSFDVVATWAGTLVVGLLGYLLNLAFMVGEHYTLGWYRASAE